MNISELIVSAYEKNVISLPYKGLFWADYRFLMLFVHAASSLWGGTINEKTTTKEHAPAAGYSNCENQFIDLNSTGILWISCY